MADVVRETAVYQIRRLAAKFFIPSAILGLLLDDLLQTGSGVVFGPGRHVLLPSSEEGGRISARAR